MTDIKDLEEFFPLQFGKNNAILRKICDPIEKITNDVKLLADVLPMLMREKDGIGLAAPQIGQTVRMIAITQRDTSKKKRELLDELIMINPVLLGQSKETCIEEEACLSLPKESGKVERSISITVKFQTIDGKEHIHKADDYNARIILHEMDHLDGILFTDKVV